LNSLIELKQAIDSMESRIEDTVVDLFQQQLLILDERYAAKTAVISVIKMMQAIGRYLGSRRDTADKDAFPILNSLSIELEKLVTDTELTKEQINQILSECIKNYKFLKSKVASQPLVTKVELQDLKAVILAIDWEISEITLKTFDTVTTRMLTRLKYHKILHAYLMIIHSMGRYIASKKATAHKDSLSFLRSVFENFERIVQRPDMPLKEKQQLIEKDIGAFHNFKRELASLERNSPVSIDKPEPIEPIEPVEPVEPIEPVDTMEDEIIQPALSHITASSRQVAEDVVPLSPSSETSFAGQSLDDENITPALAGRKKTLPAPRDIMEDLFSGKESPADELLDAIHLANVQGPDQKRAMNMEPTKEELQEEGIKNFTPHRMGNEPIPEIGNRLDEFFNLDIPESQTAQAIIEKDAPLEPADDSAVSPADDSSPMETIVPFQYEDESFEETLVEENTGEENTDQEYSTQTILNRVSSLVKTHNGLLEEQTAIDRDISYLKTRWLDDSDKTMLVDIISCLLMKAYPPALTGSETMVGEIETAVPTEQLNRRPSGFWGKIKSVFFKSE
jgi:hypothetical protein